MNPGERGSGTLLVAAALMAAGIAVALVVAVATAIAAAQRVRGAADLVAISAAIAYADGVEACPAADRIAAANQVVLRSCAFAGDLLDFAITVEVGTREPRGMLPADYTARARAGSLISG